jgi:hypothetical protein
MFKLMAGVLVAVGGIVHGMFGFGGNIGGGGNGPGGGPGDAQGMPSSMQVQGQGQMDMGNMSGQQGQGMGMMADATTSDMHRGGMSFGILGVISSVNGTTFTIESHLPSMPMHEPMQAQAQMMNSSSGNSGQMPGGQGSNPQDSEGTTSMTMSGGMRDGMAMMMGKNATTTFTVDASQAKILGGLGTTTISLAALQIGSRVVVQGPVTGTSIAAKIIIEVQKDSVQGGFRLGDRGQNGNGTTTTTITTKVRSRPQSQQGEGQQQSQAQQSQFGQQASSPQSVTTTQAQTQESSQQPSQPPQSPAPAPAPWWRRFF